MIVKSITGRKILSSMGSETVEVTMETDKGESKASVPAGISAGKNEVVKVPATEALSQIEKIAGEVVGKEWTQQALDKKLFDLNLAGNATLGVSAAFWKKENRLTPERVKKFPQLFTLMFEGAKHGNEKIRMQEFLVIEQSVERAREDFLKLRDKLSNEGVETLVGAEGGFSPVGFDDEKVLETLKEVFPEGKLAVDAAGSFQSGGEINYEELLLKYAIVSLEDPFGEEDWEKWQEFFGKWGEKILVVGDDLTATNPVLLQKALGMKTINAIIIKPNQNGMISSTIEVVNFARDKGLKIIVSHRGEDTDDDWIVDFSLAVEADYVKFGGVDRGERVAKYNRLLELGMK